MTFMDYIDAIIEKGIIINKNTAEIVVHSPMAVNSHTLSVSPMSITCATYRHDDEAEYEAIKWAIDFDKWQHSWHNEVKPENYAHFLEIIQGKVIEKSEALIKLNAVAIFLENSIRNTPVIQTTGNKYDDCEPF